MSPERLPSASVDLDAIRANVRAVADAVQTPLLAVVKADAYGHGMLPVARAAVEAGASWLGVADAAEGVALRAGGLETPILAWIHSPGTTWFSAFAAELDLAVSSMGQLALLAEAAEDPRRGRHAAVVGVHVKVDTGLGRNGAMPHEWAELFGQLAELERRGSMRCRGIMSHLSGTSEAADAAQLAQFDLAIAAAERAGLRPEVRHIAASAGAIANPAARYDLVRLGVSAYGLTPFGPDRPLELPLRQALRVEASVVERAPSRGRPAERVVELGLVDGLPPIGPGRISFADELGRRWRASEVRDVETVVELVEARAGAAQAAADAGTAHAEPAGGQVATVLEEAAEPTVLGAAPAAAGEPSPVLAVIDPLSRSADADAWAAAGRTINYEIPTRFSRRHVRRYLPEAPEERVLVPWPPLEDPSTPRLAPIRHARIDLDLARERLRDLAARARGRTDRGADLVDVSADAYGHGALDLVPLIRTAGLRPLVRTARDAEECGRRGQGGDLVVDPNPPASSRALYGFDPAEPARPLMSLLTELVAVKRVQAGQGVSYGHEWVAPGATTLGLIPIGYADAIPRRAGGRAEVAVGGVRVPIVGRVAMDQCVVDLGDLDVWPGVGVVVFGSRPQDPTIREWARWSQVPEHVVTSTLGPRVERIAQRSGGRR